MICAEWSYLEGDTERHAAFFIGSEFDTVGMQDFVQAAREAAELNFDLLIACDFNYVLSLLSSTTLAVYP